ncbi:MAG: alpha/beta fold hydrolase [Gammaproteobacteria bacterium]|nr:alpha/beta fold hydrolase [Gammaproteobacteria bacterium]MDH5262041.1 alpha/beta fold hydrolase [Gammaproteobacteria bacterium]MDH5584926.1 alpha/beta fold hydrolase [Gammaproteobacteria bacterium]
MRRYKVTVTLYRPIKVTVTLIALLASGVAAAGDCVVLLHGLARTASSMSKMEEALQDDGYATANVDYPSRDHEIAELADIAVGQGLASCRAKDGIEKIHFVTHSLGGILLRQYLSTSSIAELGRVVMLGPPNQGSRASDEMQGVPGFDWLNGPAGYQLGKGENSVPLALGPVKFELGVIAGDRSIDPITSAILDNPDDGRVSVEDTKVEGMDDFVVVEHSHAFMMRMRRPIELTKAFLRTGSFSGVSD